MAGRDAEVVADVGDDGGDRATTHLGGDFFRGGQERETRVLGGVGALGFGRGVGRREALVWRARGWAKA